MKCCLLIITEIIHPGVPMDALKFHIKSRFNDLLGLLWKLSQGVDKITTKDTNSVLSSASGTVFIDRT
jgi:hypothetical protein